MVSSAKAAAPFSVTWDVSSERQPDAFEAYHASMADLYEVTGVANGGKTGFQSQTTAYKMGSSTLARGRSGAQTLSRGGEQIRRSGLEHISIIVNLAATVGEAGGQSVIAPAGSVQFRNLTRPSASRTDGIDLVNVMTPLATAQPWLMGRPIHGLVLPADSPGGRLVASHLTTLAEIADALTEDEGVAAIEATFAIAERYLGAHRALGASQIEAIHRTIRRRAMIIFDTAPTNVRPDVAAVALAIGVSRSSLYRAFEVSGGVLNHLERQRLDRAYAALRMRGSSSKAIAEVAANHGFSGIAQFAKAFRNRFGFLPTEIEGQTSASRSPTSSDLDAGSGGPAHKMLLDWLRIDSQ